MKENGHTINAVKELVSKYEDAIAAQRPIAEKASKKYQRLLRKYGFDWNVDELAKATGEDTLESAILDELTWGLKGVKELLLRKWDEKDVIAKERLSYYQKKLLTVREDVIRILER